MSWFGRLFGKKEATCERDTPISCKWNIWLETPDGDVLLGDHNGTEDGANIAANEMFVKWHWATLKQGKSVAGNYFLERAE